MASTRCGRTVSACVFYGAAVKAAIPMLPSLNLKDCFVWDPSPHAGTQHYKGASVAYGASMHVFVAN